MAAHNVGACHPQAQLWGSAAHNPVQNRTHSTRCNAAASAWARLARPFGTPGGRPADRPKEAQMSPRPPILCATLCADYARDYARPLWGGPFVFGKCVRRGSDQEWNSRAALDDQVLHKLILLQLCATQQVAPSALLYGVLQLFEPLEVHWFCYPGATVGTSILCFASVSST
jgi:hypothetical protein